MTNTAIPRPEHPNPQFQRDEWLNLNGVWEFEIDHSDSGTDRNFQNREQLNDHILVPFCPESRCSGIANTDFMAAVWYRRTFFVPAAWQSGRVRLHFGAADYETHVYINQQYIGMHRGGYSSFSFDITASVTSEQNTIVVCVRDDTRSPLQPRGKQSARYFSAGCDYTRTTGIWQTVWLEHVPDTHIESVRFYPNIAQKVLSIQATVIGQSTLTAHAFYQGKPVGTASCQADGPTLILQLPLDELHLWEVGKGRLYDLTLTYGDDVIHSYFGMRSLQLAGYRFLINGKSVFQRLVLDQGFYPDGIYTAPSEEALCRDIRLSQAAGFNGARLHQKMFEPRFLYHCDRMGYLIWGEHASWGLDYSNPKALHAFLPEWLEALRRDFNHPAIIGWCPFNETWDYQGRRQDDDLLRTIYLVTRAEDPTRPCIDTSGNYHVMTDIYDVHDYEQDPAVFKQHYDLLMTTGTLYEKFSDRQTYSGGPVFVSEYGGIQWDADNSGGWGYGNAPESEEEFFLRYRSLTEALLHNRCMFGFCYTQLYDVEQEVNGIYTYDRRPKFDIQKFYKINTQKASIED